MRTRLGIAVLTVVACAGVVQAQGGRSYGPGHTWWDAGQGGVLPWDEDYDNPDGMAMIMNTTGAIHVEGHPFFEALGPNRRACVTCHQPSNAMGLAAATVRDRWVQSDGKDPVFAAIDGSNCPDLPQGEAASHSLLLNRGLFRIALPLPAKAEFKIELVRDPAGCNSSPSYGLRSAHPMISVYRRPRITANLKYVTAGMSEVRFMADGREPSLESQAANAAAIHEQATTPLTPDQLREIVHFEMQVFAAQSADLRAGLLNEQDGPSTLGPQNLATGMASALDRDFGKAFDIWRKPAGAGDIGLQREFRASVARGSEVFSKRQFQIRDAATPGIYSCATCHASEKARLVDISTTNMPEAKAFPDLPLFKVTCDATAAPHPYLGRVIYTQDPGRALITGKCADVGSIMIQQFRGLAARAPYFSNGSSPDLRSVVEFYNLRFDIGFTEQEKRDLINFLKVL